MTSAPATPVLSRPAAPATRPARSPWPRVVAMAAALTIALLALLTAFAWPATETRPRDVPVAVAGPPPAVAQVRAAVAHATPGAFDLRVVGDAARARALVRNRSVYGALLLTARGPRVVVATQAGPLVAQGLTQLAQAASGGTAVPVEDLAPPPDGDEHGAGLAAGTLPMALVAAAAAVLLALRVRGFGRQVVGASVFAVLGSAGAVALLHSWLGVLDGNWGAEFGIVALALGGISLGSLGMAAAFGRAGLALAVVTDIAVGNPLSAAPSAPVLLPDGFAQLGQALPPGAMVSALRAVSGFGGTGAAGPIAVLVAWVAAGLVLLGAGALRGARRRSGIAPLTGRNPLRSGG